MATLINISCQDAETAPAISQVTAVNKPNKTTQSILDWSKRAIARSNEIAMNEDLRKEIAKRTK